MRIGTILAVAETGVHFLIELPEKHKQSFSWTTEWTQEFNRHLKRDRRQLRIPLNKISRILPSVKAGSPKGDGEK